MAKFVVFYNSELLKTYELDEPVISIGRLPENTISIANMGVSRRHVKIEEDADRTYVLSDLNSLNGTYINGKRVKKVPLHSGDKISIGKYTILYEESRGGPAVAPVPAAPVAPAEKLRRPAKEYIGSTDVSYVHRTTEPRMRAVVERSAKTEIDDSRRDGGDGSVAVLIETNKHVVYKLDKRYLTMGSSEDDDIFVSGFMVGERQVAIEIQADGIYIYTTRMMGKLKINGKPRRRHRLQHKDRIEVGTSTFRFMENG